MTTPLININSEIRQRINNRLYTNNLLIEHLGTPNPSVAQIQAWKNSWPDGSNMVAISSLTKAKEIIKQQEIPELLYRILYTGVTSEYDVTNRSYGNNATKFIQFYREEDLILFKIMHTNS